MKRWAFFIAGLLLAFTGIAQEYPAKPNPPKLVNDFTSPKLLTPDQEQALENKLMAYNDTTSTQIAIVILESIGGSDPGDYATELGRRWEVGQKGFNNGVVILLTTGGGEGRRHAFIAPGYGLEKAIPDYTAKEIVDNELIPYLKEKDYFRALNHTVDAIIQAAAGQYTAPEGYGNRGGKEKGSPLFFIIAIIVIIMFIVRNRGGGRGGGMMSRRGYRRSSASPIWWLPMGGGGGGWSGGGGGGGFGGFGGGSFGGGGAGGSW
ncbi:MAG TPA: TPM domain-containing protein [Chitinophagaceae bacterium]|nr:TPM domain-containing protein [Chitinophagaceae bacterium]